MAERTEPGGGQAPADTKPVISFLTAGHLLGRNGACPVLAGCGESARQRASADTPSLLALLLCWHGLGGQPVQLGSPCFRGR
jgi:hypothetical protein